MPGQNLAAMLAVDDSAMGSPLFIGIFNNRERALNILWLLDRAGQVSNVLLIENTVAFPDRDSDEAACINLVECAAVGESEE